MNITTEEAKNSEIKVAVELTELEFEKYYLQAIENFSKQMSIKGFRPGKIPTDVVEKEIGKEQIQVRAADLALAPSYLEAIKEKKIEPIGKPRVNVLSMNPLKYEATIPVYPTVEMGKIKDLKISKNNVVVKKEDIDEELVRIRGYHASYNDVDRAAKKGDRVEVDFDGFDQKGVALEGTSSKNHPLIIGENTLIPGFEEHLEGMKKEETKEFDITFPKDYFHKPFQSKTVKFKVKVNRIEERHLPELDAEFIKKVAGKDMSLEEFTEEVKKNLVHIKEDDEKARVENELLKAISETVKVDLSPTLIEEEVDYILEDEKAKLQEKGLDFADYLKAVNKKEAEWKESKKEEAVKRLTLRFGVQEAFKLMNIEVAENEIEVMYKQELAMLEQMNYSLKEEELNMLKFRIENKLKLDKLIAKFTV